jgi:hypothetical protein
MPFRRTHAQNGLRLSQGRNHPVQGSALLDHRDQPTSRRSLAGPTVADAVLDRLIHYAYRLI